MEMIHMKESWKAMPREWLLHEQCFHAAQPRETSEDHSVLLTCLGQSSRSRCPLVPPQQFLGFQGRVRLTWQTNRAV